jgi:hypothetical protein
MSVFVTVVSDADGCRRFHYSQRADTKKDRVRPTHGKKGRVVHAALRWWQ